MLAMKSILATGLAVAVAAGVLQSATAGTVETDVQNALAASRTVDIFVKMKADADLTAASLQGTLEDQRNWVHDTLTAQADASQGGVRALLDGEGATYKSYWINNSLFVPGADADLVAALAERDDVAYIRRNKKVPLVEPVKVTEVSAPEAVEWGVQRIGAPNAWAMGYIGQNRTVANIDTGVRYTHEALVASYRGRVFAGAFDHDYNWYDPSDICGGAGPWDPPCDNNGHGTHTMGTIAGGDGMGPAPYDIGVAPGAKWMACKGCESNSCSDFALIECAQWIACPTWRDGMTNPNCGLAPDVVNNSWGGGGGNDWYYSYVSSWLAAGIYPVFSAGNNGPGCSTLGSPGDYRNLMGVGATDINDQLASFSSKGPGVFKTVKPDVVAPGQNVVSAYNNCDNCYAALQGTSMAAPHVAGVAALMLSKNPALSAAQTYRLIRLTAYRGLNPPQVGPDNCGGRPYYIYPNAIYGAGLVQADKAVRRTPPL